MIGKIHHVRGRLRIGMQELKRNEEKARAVKKAISAERGIRSVEINVLTGSLLVYYDPSFLNAEAVLATIRDRGKLRLEGTQTNPERPLLQVKVANAVLWWAVEKAVERSIPLVIGAFL